MNPPIPDRLQDMLDERADAATVRERTTLTAALAYARQLAGEHPALLETLDVIDDALTALGVNASEAGLRLGLRLGVGLAPGRHMARQP